MINVASIAQASCIHTCVYDDRSTGHAHDTICNLWLHTKGPRPSIFHSDRYRDYHQYVHPCRDRTIILRASGPAHVQFPMLGQCPCPYQFTYGPSARSRASNRRAMAMSMPSWVSALLWCSPLQSCSVLVIIIIILSIGTSHIRASPMDMSYSPSLSTSPVTTTHACPRFPFLGQFHASLATLLSPLLSNSYPR